MRRCVEPELLDELPPDESPARGSRRDLRRLNTFMGHYSIMARSLRAAFPTSPPARILELGCGDGTFLWKVARRLAGGWRGVKVVLLDRHCLVKPGTLEGFSSLGWTVEVLTVDIFDWLKEPNNGSFDAVVANLFLHHFSERQLTDIFRESSRRTAVFAALEPRRSRWPLLLSRMLWVIGCNHVTRHDAPASVRAGFADRELSRLWPEERGWRVDEHSAALFSHSFVARREQRQTGSCQG